VSAKQGNTILTILARDLHETTENSQETNWSRITIRFPLKPALSKVENSATTPQDVATPGLCKLPIFEVWLDQTHAIDPLLEAFPTAD
jgi:hypothetical protein